MMLMRGLPLCQRQTLSQITLARRHFGKRRHRFRKQQQKHFDKIKHTLPDQPIALDAASKDALTLKHFGFIVACQVVLIGGVFFLDVSVVNQALRGLGIEVEVTPIKNKTHEPG